jgi:16S rRNA (guanine(966)-N(2))-methyltransferase RsmD
MSLRVIAGSAKGRRLKLVPGDSTRPIMDRVKEALFSIIGRDIIDCAFLDLFAGTGSVGIEALSRGARAATFIDLDRHAIQTIHENLKITGLAGGATVRRADALAVIRGTPPAQPFDFLYIAPPQYHRLWLEALRALDANPGWLTEGASVIVQIDPRERQDAVFRHMLEYDQRVYGKTLLWFFDAHPGGPEAHGQSDDQPDQQPEAP